MVSKIHTRAKIAGLAIAIGTVALMPLPGAGATGTIDALSPTGPQRSSTIASVEAFSESGAVSVRFTTSGLGNTAGFILYRFDETADTWIQVNSDLLPAVAGAAQGGVYELRDELAPADRHLVYAVVEVGTDGGETVSGPFKARVETRSASETLLDSSRGKEREKATRDDAGTTTGKQSGGTKSGGRASAGDRMKIETSAAGVYFVSRDEIAQSLGIKPQRLKSVLRRGNLRLWSADGEVAWHATDDGLGLAFFSPEPSSPYSDTNVYWLELGRGRTMVSVDGGAPPSGSRTASPVTTRFEVDAMPVTSVSSVPIDDFWFWSYVAAGHPVYGRSVHQFTVDEAVVASGTAMIEVELHGATSTAANPDHRADFRINGVPVGSATWDGAVAHRAAVSFPADILRVGANELEVSGVRLYGVPYSVFLVDGFDLTCERAHQAVAEELRFDTSSNAPVTMGGFSSSQVTVLDTTDQRSPELVSNLTATEAAGGVEVSFYPSAPDRRYLALGAIALRTPDEVTAVRDAGLESEAGGAEYLVITPRALRPAADDLAAYRSATGMSVLTVEAESIYDEFGGGVPTPEAIRAYLLNAFTGWRVAPRFVVLAGAGTFDYRDLQGQGGNLLPPFMVSTPYGVYASDMPFADLMGDDSIPEIAVGRIPATSNQELQAYVEKVRWYENQAIGVEPDDVLLLADNADRAGNFPVDSDALIGLLPATASVERIYLSQQHVTEARANLQQAVRSGVSLVNYIGHGFIDRFASENLLTVGDTAQLTVSGRLPFFVALTCSAGRFEVPGWQSLAESLVLQPDGGAAAMFAPSGLSLNFEAKTINQGLFAAVYSSAAATIGEAVTEAMQGYGATGRFVFMRQIYNLLGDPAYRVR